MRAQIHLIALLSSLLLWGMSFDVTRDVYREAHQAGYIPNLHLKSHVKKALEWPGEISGQGIG